MIGLLVLSFFHTLLFSCMIMFRLAKEIQQKTPSCPQKAKKMGLKANNMSPPFKQVYRSRVFVLYIKV